MGRLRRVSSRRGEVREGSTLFSRRKFEVRQLKELLRDLGAGTDMR
jgi:hypothetical protein